jgi:hypothetical protein
MPATLLLAGDPATPRVGIADSMATVFRSTAMSPTEPMAGAVAWGQPLQIHLARNEFEGALIVIEAPSDRALHGVQIAFRPLVRDGDPASVWPKNDVSLWQVDEIEAYDLWGSHKSLGSFPDPLRPLEKSLTVQAGRRQSVLARFFARPERAAGTYRGELAVSADGTAFQPGDSNLGRTDGENVSGQPDAGTPTRVSRPSLRLSRRALSAGRE